MARKLTFVPTVSGVGLIPMEEIPQDVRDEMEEAYASLSKAEGRIRAEFDNEEEANVYCRQAASYCTQRADGALKFRRSPTKGLPKNVVDFRVTRNVEENGQRRADSPTESAKK